MKKVLVIGKFLVPKIENVEIKQVSREDGLVTFLSEDWDIVLVESETKEARPKEFSVLEDIKKSSNIGQKIFRVGFLVGGGIPLLRLPFTVEEFKKCLE